MVDYNALLDGCEVKPVVCARVVRVNGGAEQADAADEAQGGTRTAS